MPCLLSSTTSEGRSSLPHTWSSQEARGAAGGLTDTIYRSVTNINRMANCYTTSRDVYLDTVRDNPVNDTVRQTDRDWVIIGRGQARVVAQTPNRARTVARANQARILQVRANTGGEERTLSQRRTMWAST